VLTVSGSESRNQHLFYLKQASLAARGSKQLFLIFTLASLLSFWLWGTSWQFAILSGVAALFLVAFGLESLAVWSNRRASAAVSAKPADAVLSSQSDPAFHFVPDDDFDYHLRRLAVRDHLICIRISAHPGLLDAALPYATTIFADPDAMMQKFYAFKQTEAKKHTHYKDEILRLEIEAFDFLSVNHPSIASVTFTSESGGEAVTCRWDDGRFRDLVIET
jgi:hypothetical protein